MGRGRVRERGERQGRRNRKSKRNRRHIESLLVRSKLGTETVVLAFLFLYSITAMIAAINFTNQR